MLVGKEAIAHRTNTTEIHAKMGNEMVRHEELLQIHDMTAANPI